MLSICLSICVSICPSTFYLLIIVAINDDAQQIFRYPKFCHDNLMYVKFSFESSELIPGSLDSSSVSLLQTQKHPNSILLIKFFYQYPSHYIIYVKSRSILHLGHVS